MKKRMVSVLLGSAMVASLLAGCGSSSSTATSNASKSASSAASSSTTASASAASSSSGTEEAAASSATSEEATESVGAAGGGENVGSVSTVSEYVTQTGEKLKVGFAQIGQESGWRDGETNDVQWYAAKHTDEIDLTFADAQQKQENQIKAIRNFIDMGVDVIAFPPVVETGWKAVLTECKDAGIPVILVDRGVDDSCKDLYATEIASDMVWEGQQAADVLADAIGGKGNVVEIEGTVGASAANGRKEGFDKEIADKYPDIKILDSQSGDFTRANGKEVMESFLKSYPDINGVFCHNDDMGMGAIEAIKEAGKKPGVDIKIVGCDGIHDAFQAMVDGEYNGTVECTPLLAKEIFNTAAKLKAGESVPKWIKSPDQVFTQDQAADVIDSRTAY